MARGALVVLVTAPREKAKDIARHLIKNRLAACVNVISEVESIYWWQGKIEDDREALLIIKTRIDVLPRLMREVKRVHPYQVPEIIALPIVAGLEEYLEWLESEVKNGGSSEP
ncbi:MAG: divalent-cation tolerance protein CutA [Desulfurococcales archaeon]|nr:divalent-cation tolerance protein CutA [Desulfurococcales archaeon]